MRCLLLFASFLTAMGATVVLDRIAVVVGKHVIKSSDINRDLRLTEFLNHQPPDLSAPARRKAAERLIDQHVIRTELATGSYNRASDAQADGFLKQIIHDRFGGLEVRLRAELSKYDLTVADLRAELLWQLTVLQFIQQRFQPGVSITDEEIKSYYDQHRTELQRQNSRADLDTSTPKIRSVLESQAVDKAFDEWLKDARGRTQIEYREGAFQ